MTNPPSKTVTIDDIELVLSSPVDQDQRWEGQQELMDQLLASWLVVSDDDVPLCPRLVGRPGVGKTTLAYCAARSVGLPVYIHQCTVDTRPEDLLVTPVLARDKTISYHASPLVSAMVRGGAVILDEANRMSEKSWASLAPLFDHRRYIDSIVAGIRISAHASFRACVTMNDDASTFEVPDYMLSRIQPTIELGFPERAEELRILKYHLPFAPQEVLNLTVDFLQGGHEHGLPYSVRDGINIVRYTLKRRAQRGTPGGAAEPGDNWSDEFRRAVDQILGPDAGDFKRQTLDSELPGLVDFRQFFETLDEMELDDGDEDDRGDEGPRG